MGKRMLIPREWFEEDGENDRPEHYELETEIDSYIHTRDASERRWVFRDDFDEEWHIDLDGVLEFLIEDVDDGANVGVEESKGN